MKALYITISLIVSTSWLYSQNIGIGTLTPDASAVLDIVATDKGLLVPRADTVDVMSPANGLLIFQSSDNQFYFFNGTKWTAVGADNLGDHTANQNIILNDNWLSNDGDDEGLKVMPSGGVVIGDDMTNARFDVKVDSAFINEVEDQSANVTGIPVTINATLAGAQNLLVGQTGDLSRLDVLIRTTGTTSDFQLEIRSGSIPDAGSILSTENFSFSNNSFDTVQVMLTTPVPVANGDPLVFIVRWLSGDNAEWQRSDMDIYANGHSFIEVAGWIAVTDKDFWFTTHVEQDESTSVSRLTVIESGQTGIGTSTPDVSAILDIVSTEKGVLVPRMTTVQRLAIGSPANGLLVYDTNTGSFWYYKSSEWTNLLAIHNKLVDADGDTKIQVEKTADEDVIRFDLAGNERMVLIQNADGHPRLELINSSGNTFLGEEAGLSNTTGVSNTATGRSAFLTNTTGFGNTATGREALTSNTTGYDNTAIGRSTLLSNTTGFGNTATGREALLSNTTGSVNTANGYKSLYSNTTGNYNTANGLQALYFNNANSRSTAIGTYAILYADDRTSGRETFNTAIGYQALRGSTTAANNTGQFNTAVGDQALYSNTSGSNNTATGRNALIFNKTGNSNTANGVEALYLNNTGNDNTATGRSALNSNTTGSDNTAIGRSALLNNKTGFGNTATGRAALYSNNTGISNTATGMQALYHNIANSQSTAIGTYAMFYADSRTTGRETFNTAIGYEALRGSTTAANNTGQFNTAVGDQAMFSNTTGSSNTAQGAEALFSNTTGTFSTAIGFEALLFNTTGISNTAIGMQTLYHNRANSRSTAIGKDALFYADDRTTGRETFNTAIGYQAMQGSTTAANNTGQFNTAIGDQAMVFNSSGSDNTATGVFALRSNTTGSDNTATGYRALFSNTTGAFNTAIGMHALYDNIANSRSTAIGKDALFYADDRTTGRETFNTAIGYEALRGSTISANNTGQFNTAVGDQALVFNSTGSDNTASGKDALRSNTTGNSNTATGVNALHFNTIGFDNTCTGRLALYNNQSGEANTAFGRDALHFNTTGNFRVGIGFHANSAGADYHNSTGLGNDADCTASNQVRIGNGVTSIGGPVDWTIVSDQRFKKEVAENVIGLEFIKRLRPVTYYFDQHAYEDWKFDNYGERNASNWEGKYDIEQIQYTGFIAQEVDAIAQSLGYDFSGVDAPKNDKDYYGLRYAAFTVPLVKAVQELVDTIGGQQQMIEDLKKENAELKLNTTAQIERLEQSHAAQMESLMTEFAALKEWVQTAPRSNTD